MDSVLNHASYVEHDRANGSLTVAISLNERRAFGTVSHIHQLQGLVDLNIRGHLLRWLHAFIRNGEIFSLTSLVESKRHKLSNVVPQGSILSPNLLNALMAQLPTRLPSTVKFSLYADDICVRVSGRNWNYLQNPLQSAVQVTEHFLNERGMGITPAKSAVLAFTRKKRPNFLIQVGHALPFICK